MKTFKEFTKESVGGIHIVHIDAEARNIGKGLGRVYNTQQKSKKNYPVGSKVKTHTGAVVDVVGHEGVMVNTTGGWHHHTKVSKV